MDSAWAELREAQLIATHKLPHVGMAVITDVGEENDIHPKKKEPVGARLALLARRIAYGQPIVANGPTYHSMRVEGNRAVVYFDNFGSGLERRGDKLTGFTIAGADHKFVNAQAEIQGNTVIVVCAGRGKARSGALRLGELSRGQFVESGRTSRDAVSHGRLARCHAAEIAETVAGLSERRATDDESQALGVRWLQSRSNDTIDRGFQLSEGRADRKCAGAEHTTSMSEMHGVSLSWARQSKMKSAGMCTR